MTTSKQYQATNSPLAQELFRYQLATYTNHWLQPLTQRLPARKCMYISELVNLTNSLIIVLILAFKLINNIVYLTTLHKNRADAQINKIILSFNELLSEKPTSSIYSLRPYNHKLTLLGCTVRLKCSVLYQYCVHNHSTLTHIHNKTRHSSFIRVALLNKHPNTHTTRTYTLTINLFCLQTIFNYISSWLTLVI